MDDGQAPFRPTVTGLIHIGITAGLAIALAWAIFNKVDLQAEIATNACKRRVASDLKYSGPTDNIRTTRLDGTGTEYEVMSAQWICRVRPVENSDRWETTLLEFR